MRSVVRDGAKGVIVDLHDNPGGLISQAISSVSLFVDEGVVCTTAGSTRTGASSGASGDPRFPDVPLVILVNAASAAPPDLRRRATAPRRALVVGRRTFGKASVQSIRPLANGGALKLTTATYRTPRGHDLGEKGVRPTFARTTIRARVPTKVSRARSASC